MITDAAGDEVIEDHCPPGYKGATNNQMELMACIKALELARGHAMLQAANEVWIYTDSMYVAEFHTKAIFEWPKSGWKNRDGRPIENVDLWRDLVQAIKKVHRRVRFHWVKGHSKNVHNKAADRLARESANSVLNEPLRVTAVRRKRTTQAVSVGSVTMEGQTMSVRIVTDTYMREQKLYKYMYEVLTESSPYCGNCDYIYSELLLRAGHHYEVRVNDNSRNPHIVEVLHEIDAATGAPLDGL